MTELLHPDRLRLIARVLDQPAEAPRRLIPVMQWYVDVETGRPAGRWVLDEARDGGR